MSNRKCIFGSAARLEFVQANEYYRNISPGLKKKFKAAFDEALEAVRSFPEAWPQIEETPVRAKSIRGFPYSIIYLDDPDAIYIVAVAHQRQEPLYWLKRLHEPGRE